MYESKTSNGTTFLFTEEVIVGIVYPHGLAVVPVGPHIHKGPTGDYIIAVAERALLALPMATGSPDERKATLDAAIDKRAAELRHDYGALAKDRRMRALMAAESEAIADLWNVDISHEAVAMREIVGTERFDELRMLAQSPAA